ncbi:hypothetical protein ONZ51_g8975 [Trametes cubensis]|uniref:Uncharacterized protein n=1 Tax=Trametes cubensis TaxID=1111947 RepID=A0AAD7TPQ8_9APHY|nr:hypothetical protein ONZ51_g8975 [Trametes cubensis]
MILAPTSPTRPPSQASVFDLPGDTDGPIVIVRVNPAVLITVASLDNAVEAIEALLGGGERVVERNAAPAPTDGRAALPVVVATEDWRELHARLGLALLESAGVVAGGSDCTVQ